MKKIKYLFILLCFIINFSACSFDFGDDDDDKNSSKENKTRSFYMGFTPWPYAATTQALADVYSFINSEGDLVAHHFQQGIPFTATNTLDFTTYHQNVQNEINDRISSTSSGKEIYLAIDSLNGARDDLTDLWEADSNMARTAPWNTRSFNDAEVITAYVNFSIAVIEKFRTNYGALPEYFNYGSEISDLMINDPAKFSEFLTFAQTVYTTLKATYPTIQLMVSIALKTPGSTEMITAKNGFDQIKNYVDIVGISTYGYAFYSHSGKGNPENLPSDWISQVKIVAPGKPYAVVETGWIAENINISAYPLIETSNEDYQNKYVEKLFDACNNDIDAEIIIWFTSYDYDTLWNDNLGDDLSKIWVDTGLIDENFNERAALSTWRSWLSKQKE